MQFLVAPIVMPQGGGGGLGRPARMRDIEQSMPMAGDGSIKFTNSKDRPTGYFTDIVQAEQAAKVLAEASPGVNYAVFVPASIYEGRKAVVDIVAKEINGSGELVVKRSESE